MFTPVQCPSPFQKLNIWFLSLKSPSRVSFSCQSSTPVGDKCQNYFKHRSIPDDLCTIYIYGRIDRSRSTSLFLYVCSIPGHPDFRSKNLWPRSSNGFKWLEVQPTLLKHQQGNSRWFLWSDKRCYSKKCMKWVFWQPGNFKRMQEVVGFSKTCA